MCKEMQSRFNDIRDCLSCEDRIELLPDNRAAWEIYLIVRCQYITAGMDGTVIDINHNAVIEVLKLYDCYNVDVFEKIIYLTRMDIEKLHKQREQEYKEMKHKNK